MDARAARAAGRPGAAVTLGEEPVARIVIAWQGDLAGMVE